MVTGIVFGLNFVGGICGSSRTTISQCASAGTIQASYVVGGISGGDGEIKNCYSIANVISEGSSFGSSMACGIGYYSTNCYFAGTIYCKDTDKLFTTGYEITGSYYDSQKTNILNQEGALSTKEMKQQTSFYGWDFDKIWTIQEGVDYPKLRSLQK